MPTSWRVATGTARCRRRCSGGWPDSLTGTGSGPSPRSTWARRAGRRTLRTCSVCSPATCGWPRTRCPPTGGSPPARALVGLREMPKFLLITVMARARAVLAAIGDELAGSAALDRADDVFFLDFDEVKAVAAGHDLRSVVAERRARYEGELSRRHVPRVV